MATDPTEGSLPAGYAVQRERLVAQVDDLQRRHVAYPQRYVYVLMVVSLVDGSDRQLLSTVFEDIKRTFDATDAQLGLLTAAYSAVATLSVIPFGFLTDRWHRVRLIALGFIPWSIAQIWSGAAGSFGMLFLARLFLGSIEATNGPSTPSLIGDYYPVERRSRIFGILGVGSVAGAVVGLGVGGVVASLLGWRAAFVIWGVAGFVTGAVVLKLLPEPARGIPDAIHRAERRLVAFDALVADGIVVEQPAATFSDGRGVVADYRTLSVSQAIAAILRIRSLWVVFAGFSVAAFFTAGFIWVPTFYRRYHGLSAGAAGGVVAVMALLSVVGIFVGGRFGDRFLRRGRPQLRIVVSAACQILSMVLFMVGFATSSLGLSVVAVAAGGFATAFPSAGLQAAMLDVVVPHLRGRASAAQAALRVIATASSPLLFGVLSDRLGLRSAWLATAPVLGLSGLVLLLAVASYPREAAWAQDEAGRQSRREVLDDDPVGDERAEATPLQKRGRSGDVQLPGGAPGAGTGGPVDPPRRP